MSGVLAKEQRRNLRKALGADAVDTLERCIAKCNALELRQAAIAQQFAVEKADRALADQALTERLDSLSAWCLKNEQAVQSGGRDVGCLADDVIAFRDALTRSIARRDRFERMTLLERLRWAVLGTVPSLPTSGDDIDVVLQKKA